MTNKFRCIVTIVLFLLVNINALAQTKFHNTIQVNKKHWVDSVYQSLNIEERIGQLFMVAAYSGGPNLNQSQIEKLIKNHQIGGLIFMQGGPARQAILTNEYQSMAQVPLLIGMDAEWGLGMRLDSVINMPRQMMIGASQDTTLMYDIAKAIAYQCKRLGVHVNFAPVIDVNNNPLNPVINSRSFGENKYLVSKMGIAYMRGLQDNGVMACMKHFPGHGNTNTDSHKDLPFINRSITELHNIELYPFKQLINAGVQSAMVAHLEIPSLEKIPHIPTTLSKKTIQNLLKTEMGFKGLVFTDALNMQGVAKYFKPGEVDLKAFLAGNDILLFSQDVPTAIVKIKEALHIGTITEIDLQERVKKILSAKYDYKLHQYKNIDIKNITADINKYTSALKKRTTEASATLAVDKDNVIQKLNLSTNKIQYIGLNTNQSTLSTELKKYFPKITSTFIQPNSSKASIDACLASLKQNDFNIIAIHKANIYPNKNYGLPSSITNFIQKAQALPNTIIVLMGNAYILKNSCNANAALVMYEDDSVTQQVAANILAGNKSIKGHLPVTVCPNMKADTTASTSNYIPFNLNKTDQPLYKGIVSQAAIQKLNQFMNTCIKQQVFPGARIIALQNNHVIYNECFGYIDYQKTAPVTFNTMYDVASITKVLSTTLAIMKLYDDNRLKLNRKISDFLPWTLNTDKANITIKDLLLHQAGLKAWIPFYKETLDSITKKPRIDIYQSKPNDLFTISVAENMYMRKDYIDTIWQRILTSPLENKGKYVYSDLDFLFLQKVVEEFVQKPINVYVNNTFYKPMQLHNITYLPIGKYPKVQIAPTEQDNIFRNQLVWSYVHDQAAAMLGGVAGHAGLFATVEDVANIFLMLQKGGIYKGKRYFQASTVQKFTTYNSPISRRGLGFDKPNPNRDDAGPCGNRSSGYTFGHQGFTGTCAWSDPTNNIVFVFLSNRVNPNADNNAINRLSVRTVTQDYIYEALGIPKNSNRSEVYQSQIKTM